MWFTRTANGFRGWFVVVADDGSLRVGLGTGDFTVTIVDSDDTDSLVPSVSESTVKPGLYHFDVTSTFLVDNGIGEYGISVEVSATGPVLRDAKSEVLRVNQQDLDSISGATWATLRAGHAAGTLGRALNDLFLILGLDPATPLVGTRTARTAGATLVQAITDDGTTVTVTRS